MFLFSWFFPEKKMYICTIILKMMQRIYEDLLSFVWQYRKLPLELSTTEGETLEIHLPGNKNNDAGPDFFGAKIKIGETLWAGNVEIHVKTSDWLKHGHHHNPAYESVILHVVYENDEKQIPEKLSKIPVLELKPYISSKLVDKYYRLMASASWIPCQENLSSVQQMSLKPWLSVITEERLKSKTHTIREMLAVSKMDWENTFFQWFSSCFGFKLNNDAFLMLARSVPFKVLMKHRDNLQQLEAILFGQSGLLLNMHKDHYAKALKKEYDFLALKYQLHAIDPKVWKFMRTRPGNFPTVRISQLSGILSVMDQLLAEMFGKVNPATIKKLLNSEASEYWQSHFHFGKSSDSSRPKHLGNLATENLIINAVVPFVYLYGDFHDNPEIKKAAIRMLEQIKAEENHILKKWKSLNIVADNAAESQALIELYNSYCRAEKMPVMQHRGFTIA
jgi:hypothetical protein